MSSTVSMTQVKELRERTGAGIVNCKKALAENDSDVEKAIDFLREKGLAAAAKKAGRAAEQGVVGSYIHGGGKIGVLVEINCETDFVARTEEFQQLVKDVAMQVAAASPRCVHREEVSEAERERERAVYQAQAEESGKPANIIEKIVEGKLEKFYSEACLLEQTFIRDSSKTVKQIVQDAVTRTGENIVVHRFARFQIGEAGTVDEANE